ncbi:serine/threonine-protein kinase [cf. Phormidesmis sp. LEGE 11477]|uniref:serine/threonine-protein kinase n=1 Tax=cf. Phormidesmis sp. LEGE 11477 TaxID=1828680 RepID=UPI0018822B26|nr:serine/threonine-protein kinase [cf. Phormidesmis sp. LEGE 11477]MBE9059870.1 serine/threonine protein kinase [cf. Phormidesmis sp. LEGE 11477]
MNAGDRTSSASPPLGDRYSVVRKLGEGGFGQTYLAEDHHRYGERCVVKEFVPQVQDSGTLDKAKELFEREANVLYQLKHEQIPEFRQLLKVEGETGGRLFLVQDYVEGRTYQDLLKERLKVNATFSETEVTQLLYQLLPVLSYIHGHGLIHRDISPDNLMLRQTDGLPVLIDFGSVKEIAAAVRTQLSIDQASSQNSLAPTRIGKMGYVPQEQFDSGEADATSDLYALAVTLLVLLTGQQPQVLHDTHLDNWAGIDKLSPHIGQILKKMLSANPVDRFPTAAAVLAAIQHSANHAVAGESVANQDSIYPPGSLATTNPVNDEPINYDDSPLVPVAQMGSVDRPQPTHTDYDANTYAAAAQQGYETTADESSTYVPSAPAPARTGNGILNPGSRAPLIALLTVLGLLGTIMLFAWMRIARAPSPTTIGTAPTEINDSDRGALSEEEQARKQEIRDRHEALGIGNNTFTRLVDQLFYREYPDLLTSGPDGGRQALSQAPEDEPLRIRWDNIALDLLDRLEGQVSRQSLSALGEYDQGDRTRWQERVNRVNVGSRSLYDLTDTKFFALFPAFANDDFLDSPIGQVYYAIANDTVDAIVSGERSENVEFEPGTFRQDLSDSLAPGEGKVYTLQLTARQQLRLNLSAPADSTLLSLYLPLPTEETPFVFADSEQTTWSGRVDQSGYYEVVVVNRSSEAISYQLALAVDNVRTAPPVAPDEEESAPPSEDNGAEEPGAEGDSQETNNAETLDSSSSDAADE